jgi:O-antigen ligase
LNPRRLSPRQFSRLVHSAALPPFLGKPRIGDQNVARVHILKVHRCGADVEAMLTAGSRLDARPGLTAERRTSMTPSSWGRWFNGALAAGIIATAISTPLAVGPIQLGAGRIPFFLLALLGLWALASWVASKKRSPATPLALSASAFMTWIIIANVIHPYARIATTLINVTVAIVAALGMKRLSQVGESRLTIRTVFGFICIQSIVSILQLRANRAVGHGYFAESEAGFRRVAGQLSPSGTLGHANQLGIYSAVAVAITLALFANHELRRLDRSLVLVVAFFGSALVGLSMCRSAIVSLAIVVALTFGSKQRRRLAPVGLMMLLTVAATGVVRSDGWTQRAETSFSGAEEAGSGRMALNRQAVAIWRLDPVVGVGPGGYLDAIEANPDIKSLSQETLVVHNVWLYVLAALGAVGAALVSALILTIVQRSIKGGLWSVGLLLSIAPLLLLDVTLFAGNGLLWLGMTVGMMLGLQRVSPLRS